MTSEPGLPLTSWAEKMAAFSHRFEEVISIAKAQSKLTRASGSRPGSLVRDHPCELLPFTLELRIQASSQAVITAE